MKKWIGYILFAALVLLWLYQCKRNSGSPPQERIDTVIVQTIKIDTLYVLDTVFVPLQMDRKEIVNVRDSVYYDTLRILQDLKIRHFQHDFSYEWGQAKVSSTVWGQILDMELELANLKPQIRETHTIEKTITIRQPQRGVFLGAYAGTRGVLGQLQYLDRKGWAYGYQYRFDENAHYIGVSKKLF